MSSLPRGISILFGFACFMIAPIMAISALRVMKAGGTNVNPSQPTTTIVRGGPYRFTRNPMYLALKRSVRRWI
jgi:protein-S-isoprenylcysteine O-methyltransferase Ste14